LTYETTINLKKKLSFIALIFRRVLTKTLSQLDEICLKQAYARVVID
jgi:hypothetical protein